VPLGSNEPGSKVKMNIKNFAILQKKEIRATYKIKETLGQGSFGCVKRVMHRDLNEDRALKIIKKNTVTSESDFANEIGMLKSIDHPNVLKYFECYMDEFNYYIVTEFCPGGELLSYIVKERGINDWQAAYVMKQVLSAVNYCHARGIVHRDLKVENVLVKDVT
jgi:calcium-dependent protein kinase